ncbi:unnamed protein product [Sordaria macrospora k-hell]|uniref:WGS project CABT00000000 data, contig 2.417 n=1 Tax=Sordaria macrospora (strain ATCC MYA-333 / DSM 997 / K(L3346) / K-hell) TaxID=771870 RepID=F7WCY6_SORMK|nr:uncharacterized protein SMAC_10467 [Sordaria macrospora k-hell]CCC05748.1 unnamed protein product [Sordaria macrospora k-hell]
MSHKAQQNRNAGDEARDARWSQDCNTPLGRILGHGPFSRWSITSECSHQHLALGRDNGPSSFNWKQPEPTKKDQTG